MVLPRLAESIAVIIDSFPSYIRQVQKSVEGLLEDHPEMQMLSDEAYGRVMQHLEAWVSTELLPQLNIFLSRLTNGIIGVFNYFFNMLSPFLPLSPRFFKKSSPPYRKYTARKQNEQDGNKKITGDSAKPPVCQDFHS